MYARRTSRARRASFPRWITPDHRFQASVARDDAVCWYAHLPNHRWQESAPLRTVRTRTRTPSRGPGIVTRRLERRRVRGVDPRHREKERDTGAAPVMQVRLWVRPCAPDSHLTRGVARATVPRTRLARSRLESVRTVAPRVVVGRVCGRGGMGAALVRLWGAVVGAVVLQSSTSVSNVSLVCSEDVLALAAPGSSPFPPQSPSSETPGHPQRPETRWMHGWFPERPRPFPS